MPTPCSPVIEPPASTHALRICPASSSARCGLALTRRVVTDERMQVAVAGVEDVRDLEPVLVRERRRSAAAPRQARPRDHAVLDVVGGRDPAHRRERRLARLPDQRRARPRSAATRTSRAPARAHSSRRCSKRAVALARRGRRARRAARRRHRAGSRRRSPASAALIESRSIISIAPGTIPAATIAVTASPAGAGVVEEGDERAHASPGTGSRAA